MACKFSFVYMLHFLTSHLFYVLCSCPLLIHFYIISFTHTQLAWHYPQPVPMDLHSIAIPSIAASLPYLCRARQCIIMHTIGRMKGDPKRYQHMLNAIKYSTSLW